MNDWLDIPVVEAMEYFGGVLATASKWASMYAGLFGLVGLIWSAFKVVNSRMTVKDLWWDSLFKWVGFLLLMSLYPAITAGFAKIANEVGMKAGAGETAIVTSLTDLRDNLTDDLEVQKKWAQELEVELSSNFEKLDLSGVSFANSNSYNEYMDKIEDRIKFSSIKDKNKANDLVKEYRKKSKSKLLFSGTTLNALESILIEKEIDGSEGENLTNSYTKLNIWLKDANGEDSYYLSPSAMMRISLLNSQVIWEKENTRFNTNKEAIDKDPDLNFFQKSLSKMALSFTRLWELVLCLICCLIIILSTIFCIIQYTMTIFEYTIVVGIGALFLPLMLFDGTKDIPKKLIPVFISFMVKMIVITICIFFVFYLFIENTMNQIGSDGGMNLIVVADVLFNGIIAFILTQNAPKIAQTILTGQPQLSMGEFVQAIGTAGATAVGMGKTAVGMGKVGKKVTRGAANAGINTVGNINRGVKEMKAASKEAGSGTLSLAKGAKNADGSHKFTSSEARKMANKAAFKAGAQGLAHGMFAKPVGDLVNKAKEKGNSFLHGKTSIMPDKLKQLVGIDGGSGGAGGGSGARNPHEKPHDFMNGSFKEDEKGNRTNLTTKEFISEKGKEGQEKGLEIGQNTALKAVEKAEKRKNAEKNAKSLPTNISGGKRATEQ